MYPLNSALSALYDAMSLSFKLKMLMSADDEYMQEDGFLPSYPA
jgi:hypothetical protein